LTTFLLLGKTGQVGHELLQTLAPLAKLIAPSRAQLDLSNPDSIRAVIREAKPDVIVNAAGFTHVDEAEAQPDLAMQINATAPGIIAEAAKPLGSLLVHYSTTFVFDGTQRTPYTETDAPHPINAYGRSKLAGEQAIQACGIAHIIIRASWTFSSRRTNFALKMLELARAQQTINVIDDQVGAPTWARDYATATTKLLVHPERLRERSGIFNLSAAGQCTRYDWAELLIRWAERLKPKQHRWATLARTTSEAFVIPASRPLYTLTHNKKIREQLGIELPSWDAGVIAFMQDHCENNV
jgi:dTDP-4-dehydrorhamnose reductase